MAGHLACAAELFGDKGFARVTQWLAGEFDRVGNADFDREFSAHVRLPGVAEGDYSHRITTTSAGAMMGGIRFYGRDIGRPFVDVICHDFTDVAALADCVRREWQAFDVHWARLHDVPGVRPLAGAVVDDTVFAAPCARLTAPDGRVGLTAFGDAEEAVAMVTTRYAALAEQDRQLARNLRAADPDDVRRWHRDNTLHAITVGDTAVGALAVSPGEVLWIDGYEIQEEVILATHRGRHLAASAQAAWARLAGVDPRRLLVGTIDRLNTASRRTAARAGRSAVLESVFIPLLPSHSAQ
ncbi:hypothetical protein BCA37_15735 [Mycobacterium sp. djl-10]|nr:hypothetical protein BCA37_15735 [Mycobacterium sp. djl-10]